MDTKNLHEIFGKYLEKFEHINSQECDETFKWVVAARFKEFFDIEAPDFAAMLDKVKKHSSILIDNSRQHAFNALCLYAKEEPERVRKMFRDLYAPDDGNLVQRQNQIRAFVDQAEELRKKYYPDSWMFALDQRIAMVFVALNDLDHNYMYKATQAREFADCIGYYDDWGYGTNMKLDVYYRMCDQLVEEIKQCPEILEANASRYAADDRPKHPDNELHMLAFDIIYCCSVYHLFKGMAYRKPDMQARQLLAEKRAKAAELLEKLEQAQAQAEQLAEAKTYYAQFAHEGLVVTHKIFGEGTVTSISGDMANIHFPKIDGDKKFGIETAIDGGFLAVDAPDLSEKRKEYHPLIGRASFIMTQLQSAEKAFLPYAEYLE